MTRRASARTACANGFQLNKQFAGVSIEKFAILIIAIVGLTSACSPALNWREVRFDGSPLTALLPCKPDRASRSQPLAGAPREMAMAGCEAAGATFTVAYADVGSADNVDKAIKEWRAASNASQSVYRSHGSQVVQAAIYGIPEVGRDGPGALSTQAAETFFGGLQLPSAAGKP